MDLRALSTVTDFFVLCTAGSGRQIDALKDHIGQTLEQQGCPVWHIEGAAASASGPAGLSGEPQWVLMDCGDIVIHVLDQPTRAFYRLEELWADATRLSIPSGIAGA